MVEYYRQHVGLLGSRVLFYLSKEDRIMRYCPYCGAELPGLEISFCAECGKQLPHEIQPQTEAAASPPAADPSRKRKKKPASSRLKRESKKEPGSSIEGAPTERLSSQSEGMDREMIKKIILLVAGALLLIGLCVVLMTVL